MSEAKHESVKGHSPPYVAWSTTKTFLGTLKEHGVPGRIDRSVLGNFSGQVGSQLMTGLRFLRLIDHNGTPGPHLAALVEAYGTEEWPIALDIVLREAYEPLMAVNLAVATPNQFNDHFRALYPVEGDTVRKAQTFFLSAAKEAGVGISPYIMKNKKPRTAPTRRKPPKAKVAPDAKPAGGGGGDTGRADSNSGDRQHHQHHQQPQNAEQVLLAMLDPTKMDAEEQKALFTLLLYLKKHPQQSAAPK